MNGNRRSIRLAQYDYSQAGAYFVTICTRNREHVFGDIVNGEMVLNDAGRIVHGCWADIPAHFRQVELDEWIVMPNHVHGIIMIDTAARDVAMHDVWARHAVPLRVVPPREQFGKPVPGSLATIMRSFKSAAARRVNAVRNAAGTMIWQRNYYEHIIRNEDDLISFREYIDGNPLQWEFDAENPAAVSRTRGGQ